jgi:hypothetical protein
MMNIEKRYPISLFTLKLFVNFTHFANELNFYYLMFDSQITSMIGYLLKTTTNET